MNLNELAHSLSYEVGIDFLTMTPVSGGDISDAYQLISEEGHYFIKLNQEATALDMFETEKLALEVIANLAVIRVPKIYGVGIIGQYSYLLMEYIEAKPASDEDFVLLGKQLAEFHTITRDKFGWEYQNYIGSLSQTNLLTSTWSEFYVQQRLVPQIRSAIDKSLLSSQSIPSESQLINVCNRISYIERSSPVHGDLWSGNYLIDTEGAPYLIDPAFYYGHPDVDIAMSLLFGGFSRAFYDSYFSIMPKRDLFEERISLFQLYHLLVHLNLFGESYLGRVLEIFSVLRD